MKAITVDVGSNTVVSDRIAGFDLLRGICAIAVALYHTLAWSKTAHVYNWGTYTVYIFFVLSGASMYVAYARRFASGYQTTRFLGMRLARLLPLFLMVAVVSIAIRFRQGDVRLDHAFLSLFFQFGLGNPGVTGKVVQGGWSLGIEFAFYLLFPVMLALVASRRWMWSLALVFVSQHVFIHAVLSNGKSLAENWAEYTQFLSFAFYFLAGCAIGRALDEGWLRTHWTGLPLLIGCVAVLASTSGPTSESTILGLPGMALSLLAVVSVAAAAIAAVPSWISEKLGAASYGTYLLHPLLFGLALSIVKRTGGGLPLAITLTVAGAVTLALVLERCYEKPVQHWIKARLR